MRSIILIVSFFILSMANALSQTAVLVSDMESKQPVPFALLYLTDLKVAYSADSSGIAHLPQLQNGSIDIAVSCVGFNTQLLNVNLDTLRFIVLVPTHNHTDEVLVSSDMTRLRGENVMNISVMKLHTPASSGNITLSDALTQIPGVQQVGTGAGIGKPVIRGLSGSRVVVYAQNTRIENQQWGDEHGLGLDDTGIESVEVIKGPSSLLYGADALGGVLFFVDEGFAKRDMLQGNVTTKYFTNSQGARTSGSLKWSNGKWHINSSGAFNSHADYTDGNDDDVRNSRFNTNVARIALGYQTDKWNTAFRITLLNENYGLTEAEEYEAEEAEHNEHKEEFSNARELMEPYQQLRTQIVSWENTLYLNHSKMKVNLGWVGNERKEFENHDHEADSVITQENQELAALDLLQRTFTYNARWQSQQIANKFSVIAGSQGMLQTNKNRGEELLIPDASQTDIGAYGLLNIEYRKKSHAQLGIRFDSRQLSTSEHGITGEEEYIEAIAKKYDGLNGSIGVLHSVGEDVKLRLNISTAYRAPNTFELLSNGEHHGTQRYEIGSQYLQSERGMQLDVAFEVRQDHFEFWVNPFYNRIQNFIYLSPTSDRIEDLPAYKYAQKDATLVGTEAGIHIHPHSLDWLHIDVSYAGVSGELSDGKSLPFIPAKRIMTTARAEIAHEGFIQKWRCSLQHTYTFRQDNPARYETGTNDYQLFNASIGADLKWAKQKVMLDFGIRNVTDEIYFDHLSRYKYQGVFNQGRNFYFALAIPFDVSMR